MAKGGGKSVLSDETIFNSPIVFYAWADVADALIKSGSVVPAADGTLMADVNAIGAMISSGKRWKDDLGLNIYGPFRVLSTDPVKSNSGNIWAGLLATSLNKGDVPTDAGLQAILPQLTAYFAGQGLMESSSGDLFEAFLPDPLSLAMKTRWLNS
jgi:hypothetical protein